MKHASGQSLFEVLFALLAASIVLVGIISLSTTSVRNASFSGNNSKASFHAQKAMEWLRLERDARWAVFSAHASADPGTSWCISNLNWLTTAPCTQPITGTIFTREVTLKLTKTVNDDDTVDVEVAVKWQDAQGDHVVSSFTTFTNWR